MNGEEDVIPQVGIDVARTVLVLGIGMLAGLLLALLVQRLLFRFWRTGTSAALQDRPRWQGRAVGAVFGALVSLEFTALEGGMHDRAQQLLWIALVVALAALTVNLINGVTEGRLRIGRDLRDPTSRRRITQLRLLRRVGIMVVVVLSAATILLTFEQVRAVGASILASAGVAGVIAGIAAQGTLRNVFAGIQIAFSEPLSINDDVVIEGEWGTVEEITLTYVVVRLWDWRRLVLPTSYFLETPFQNWTKNESRLIGSVHLRVDHRVPLAEIRRLASETAAASEYHDGDVVNVQVVDSHDRTMEVRVLASAPDAPRAWDLRCELREALLTHLARAHPEALPTLRVEGPRPDGDRDAPAPAGPEVAEPPDGGRPATDGPGRRHR